MPRGLDHIGHAARDLDAAVALYKRMGFTVGARNKHSWGTHNYIVQFPGFFIEIVTLAEPEKLGDDGFSKLFGAYNGEFLKRHEGFSLLVLESADAKADEKTFEDAGISLADALRFDREAKRPDGSSVKVAFTLAFAKNPRSPDIRFFTCQQHYPENFWNPAFQKHPNGTTGVAGVVMVAAKPAEQRDFIATYSGVKELRASGNTITAKTPRGDLTVMDPVAFGSAFGSTAPSVAQGARLAALRLSVADSDAMEELLREANIAFSSSGGKIMIGAATAMGATLVFEQAK